MNFIVKNKPPRWRPTKPEAALAANARNWLAQFPNRPHQFPDAPSSDGSVISAVHTGSNSFLFDNATHGSTVATSTLVIVALSVGRGHASTEIGLACMDVHSPALTLCQFSDDMRFGGLLAALNLYAPAQLLLHSTLFDMQPAAPVLTAIRGTFAHIALVPIDRSRFNSQRGGDLLLALCLPRCAELVRANLKQYYALTSAAALLDHVQAHVVHAPLAERTLSVQFAGRSGSMRIDVESAHRLELLYPLYPAAQRRTCLYGVLNQCVTHIGQRTLRARILQPSCDAAQIGALHECVEECRHKESALVALRRLLGGFVNVDRLVRIAYRLPQGREDNFRTAEVLINQALQLKACLDAVPELFRVLSELEASRFEAVGESLQDTRYPWLSQKIHAVLGADEGGSVQGRQCAAGGGAQVGQHPNISYLHLTIRGWSEGRAYYKVYPFLCKTRDYLNHLNSICCQFFQRLYAVRKGINGMLDLNRTIYAALMDDINAEVDRLKQEYGLPLRLLYSKSRSFHVQLLVRKNLTCDRIIREMIVLHRSRTTILMTNDPLKNLNIRIDKYINEIHFVSTAIIANLLQECRSEIEAIYDLTGVIAELDVICSLVKVSLGTDYCRPTFANDMRVVQATHPFASAAAPTATAVPNNILATFEYNFFIVTGPNMSGKTIYLKTIALMQIMAQVGCYVPARSAQFRLCDKLFTRIGFNDSLGQNASSFVLEVREMNYILRNVTPNSMVIIDELCRSTNATEGERIAVRVCEQLLGVYGRNQLQGEGAEAGLAQSNSADKNGRAYGRLASPFVFFTTHFPVICRLVDRHLNVVK